MDQPYLRLCRIYEEFLFWLKKSLPMDIVRETSEEHGTNHQAGAEWAMLYSSEGLISAYGLVPSVFGRAAIIGCIGSLSIEWCHFEGNFDLGIIFGWGKTASRRLSTTFIA